MARAVRLDPPLFVLSIEGLGCSAVSAFDCFPRVFRQLGVERGNMFRPTNSVFDNEVHHSEDVVGDFRGVIEINSTWVNGVVSNNTAEIESLLDLRRKAFGYQASDVIIDVLPFLAEHRKKFL